MDGSRIVNDREIERYRRLACAAMTGAERIRLLSLMAAEEDKYIELEKQRTPMRSTGR
jgi:hypothetical protein